MSSASQRVQLCQTPAARARTPPQVPARRALERDPEAVKEWLELRYPKLRAKAKRAGGILLCQDETGFRSECSHGRSWSPRGQTPVGEVTGQRFGVNIN